MILTAVAGWKPRQCFLASSAPTARSNPPVKKELRCRIFFWIKSLKSNKISWRFTRTESMGRTSKCLEPAHLQLPALLQFIINLISRSSLSEPVAIENLWNKRFVQLYQHWNYRSLNCSKTSPVHLLKGKSIWAGMGLLGVCVSLVLGPSRLRQI